jgi:hypothetical protein
MVPNDKSTSDYENFIGKSLSHFEKTFADLSLDKQPFEAWIKNLLETLFWANKTSLLPTIKDICIQFAKAQDLAFSVAPEPKYHNRGHFKEVCLSMTELLKVQNDILPPLDNLSTWKMSDHDSWILLLCAICHDFGHDGSMNKHPFELEKKSLEMIDALMGQVLIDSSNRKNIQSTIEPIILATDPSYFPALVSKFDMAGSFSHSDCMAMLLVESDLLASTLPARGKILGERLSEEWQLTNPEAAASVKTDKGRLYFLEHIRFISPHSHALGIEDIRRVSINQVKE